jgi:hypothetical protein
MWTERVYKVRATSVNPQEWTDFEVFFNDAGEIVYFSKVTHLPFVTLFEDCLDMPSPFGRESLWKFKNPWGIVEVHPDNWIYKLEVLDMPWTATITTREVVNGVGKLGIKVTDGNLTFDHHLEYTNPAVVTQAAVAADLAAWLATNLTGLQLMAAVNALPASLGEITL